MAAWEDPAPKRARHSAQPTGARRFHPGANRVPPQPCGAVLIDRRFGARTHTRRALYRRPFKSQ